MTESATLMTALGDFFAKAPLPTGDGETCRSVALFSLAPLDAPHPDGVPVGALFQGAGLRGWYEDAVDAFPTVVAGRTMTGPPTVIPEHVRSRIRIQRSIFCTLQFPQGQAVGLLALEWTIPSLLDFGALVALRWALDDGRHAVAEEFLAPPGLDFHQVLLLSDRQILALEAHCRDEPDAQDAEAGGRDAYQRFRGLLQLFASGADRSDRPQRSDRPEHLTARFPSEPNRYVASAAAVMPGSSVLGGQAPDIELSMILAAAQALASLATIRGIHNRAAAALTELPQDKRPPLALLQHVAATVSDLDLELGFGVEAQLSIRIRVPLLPVEQYYESLLGMLGMKSAVQVTSDMLSRLTRVLQARQTETEARRAKVVGIVGAGVGVASAVAIPLTLILAFVGSNVRQALTRAQAANAYSVFDLKHFFGYYLVLLSPVVLGLAAALAVLRLYRGGPRPSSAHERRTVGSDRDAIVDDQLRGLDSGLTPGRALIREPNQMPQVTLEVRPDEDTASLGL
ncbi:MAG TPA: hypothetical protein VIJ51_12330 [Solirubrobacteraceae bacterium]